MRVRLLICLLAFLPAVAARAAGRPPAVTSHRRMTQILTMEAAQSPLLRLAPLGQSARGHKTLWLARLADPSAAPQDTVRILILCRQHGDEPASTEAALRLLHTVTTGHDPTLTQDLKRVTLYLMPMVNPDGADAMTRRNGVGADLNRDWGVFSQPETQAAARAARLIRPQIIIDAHNWDGDDPYNANCVEGPRCDETGLDRAAHGLQSLASQRLNASGYQVFQTAYGADADARLAHRYFARQGALSLLVETHSGDPGDAGDFQRRQGFYLALIHGLAHRYGAGTTADRSALEQVEGSWLQATQEAMLFAPRPAAHVTPIPAPARRPFWLWALCAYGATLWLGSFCRPRLSLCVGSGKVRRPAFVPASDRLSEARRGTPRYRHSPCSPGFRPAPVACVRKR